MNRMDKDEYIDIINGYVLGNQDRVDLGITEQEMNDICNTICLEGDSRDLSEAASNIEDEKYDSLVDGLAAEFAAAFLKEYKGYKSQFLTICEENRKSPRDMLKALEDADFLEKLFGKYEPEDVESEIQNKRHTIMCEELYSEVDLLREKIYEIKRIDRDNYYMEREDNLIRFYSEKGHLGDIFPEDWEYDWYLIYQGADPIKECWEDGMLNTISLAGWEDKQNNS